MSNYLGLHSTSFAEDRTYNYEVWNQPVVAFEVVRWVDFSRQEISARADEQTYSLNPDAKTFYDVNASLTYITESHASREPAEGGEYERTDRYTYILEVDGDGQIIGGEWYGASVEDHPDFLWRPRRATKSAVPHLDLDIVRMLVKKSRNEAMETPTEAANEPAYFEILPDVTIPDKFASGCSLSDEPVVIGSSSSAKLKKSLSSLAIYSTRFPGSANLRF